MVRPAASIQIQQPTAFLCSVYDEEREERLVARYSRKALDPLVFEFTRDEGLLHQYYRMRADAFNGILGYTEPPMAGSEHDRNGHIMVVRAGNFCVGGIRLNIKTPRKPNLLPMEKEDFRLENYFPYLRDKEMSYGQVGYVVLLPEFRYGDVLHAMVKRVFSKALSMNVAVLFATCTMLNMRRYKIDCVTNGWKNTIVHNDIELPACVHVGGIKRYLASSLLIEGFPLKKCDDPDEEAKEQELAHLDVVQ
jgi:hypothetical protein